MSVAALEIIPPKPLPPSRLWLKAMELTARIEPQPNRLFADVIADWAEKQPQAPALLSSAATLTYGALSAKVNQYARWALAQNVKPGDCVALIVPTCPDYIAAWTGITAVGGIVALVNTQLHGPSLAHALNVAKASHVIVATALADAVREVAPAARLWILEDELEAALRAFPGERLNASQRPSVTIRDRALLIYTSGTTGLPKAAYVSHHRVMSWGHWFAGLMAASPADRLYNCLPIHHSVGGVVAIASMMVSGGSVYLAEKFSARRFWADIVKWDCTMFQYIGELCRYLLKAAASEESQNHRLRLACGNGLRGDVWEAFQSRFNIPQILEFYAATEGNFSLFNVEGKPGSIGRIPPFISHRFPAAIVKFDTETGKPLRGPDGLCIAAERGEPGEALGRISGPGGGRFEGYTDEGETERKVLRDVLEQGDAWFRTGDLMRLDDKGFYYFVDRIGDTFRWKGENVATAEVAAAIAAINGVADVNVYGVAIPGSDGKAGMAAIVREPGFDPNLVYKSLAAALPVYARPLFLRLRSGMELTETFKQKKTDLAKEGFAPSEDNDPVLIIDNAAKSYVPLTPDRFDAIMAGSAQL
ncbi:long-chain-acyl-CoA synthetase [Aestuariivirga litoralis]|uniref:long-chain-acyl-CoA synthetase n=1 Tax=Aestuariivirga litoralis TaxID=2650924 RepID=UPI0018C4E817|nr:long-chain-acyl-CoA synthetase [Aestuariivirga litoralis]MBG1233868.1 long-chain-acyl-CoA synthetase [Aestuariivirga litoralis]